VGVGVGVHVGVGVGVGVMVGVGVGVHCMGWGSTRRLGAAAARTSGFPVLISPGTYRSTTTLRLLASSAKMSNCP
jgi:hypothetical protein